jgi:hypothetical protein
MSSKRQTTVQKRSKITTNSSPNVHVQDEENLNQSSTIEKELNDENNIDVEKNVDENLSLIDPEIKIKIEPNPVTISETVEDDEEISIISPVKTNDSKRKRLYVLEDNEEESDGKFEFITIFITCKYNIHH